MVGKQVTPKVDLEELARELGAMEPWETVGAGMTDPKQSAPGRQVHVFLITRAIQEQGGLSTDAGRWFRCG